MSLHRSFLGALGALAALTLTVPAAAQPLSPCVFAKSGDQFAGGCGKLLDQIPAMQLAPATAITSGRWRDGDEPVAVWSGHMTDEGNPDQPLELEIHANGQGVLRTEYGWYGVSHFAVARGLSFDIDASGEVLPNALDAKIVRRADEILSSTQVWNRADDRRCPDAASAWSIYCAMRKATIELTGGFHHRRAALEAVRAIVEERSAGRNYEHRLRDYNNDPTTTLGDVRSLFAAALAGMQDPGWLKAHGFADGR